MDVQKQIEYWRSGSEEAWVARLPEPTALTLLTLGGLAMMRRKRR